MVTPSKAASMSARIALLLMGATAAALPTAAPAQKKKQEEAPKGPQLSPEFRKAAVPAETAIRAIRDKQRASLAADVTADLAVAEPLVAAAEAAAKTEDDIYYKQIFRLQIEDQKIQAAAKGNVAIYRQRESALVAPLTALLANPKSSASDRGTYANRLGEIAYETKNYAEAVRLFELARTSGYAGPNLGLNIVRAKAEGGDIAGGLAALKQLIDAEQAAGRKAPESWFLYARSKTNSAKMMNDLLDWSRAWVAAYPTEKNWREALVFYGFAGPYKLDKRERIDIFRLLRVTKALSDQKDYAEYAQDLFDVGLPQEAKAVIDEGRAAGKVPATGGPNGLIYADSLKTIQADGPLDALAKRAAAAPTGVLAAATGDAFLGSANYARAIELYKLAMSKGGVAKPDEVTMHIGIAQALSGDKAAAKATFQTLTRPPRQEIANFWLLWIDSVAAPTA